jgi:hypothetical protein
MANDKPLKDEKNVQECREKVYLGPNPSL